MTKAANKPPLTRIPNIMRNAPLSSDAGAFPNAPTDSQPYAQLVTKFAMGANFLRERISNSFQDVAH
jgi:hypothetical protein